MNAYQLLQNIFYDTKVFLGTELRGEVGEFLQNNTSEMNCDGCIHGDCYKNYAENPEELRKHCLHCRRYYWEVKSDYYEN